MNDPKFELSPIDYSTLNTLLLIEILDEGDSTKCRKAL